MTSSDTPNPATATKWMPVRLIEPTPDGFLLVAISTGPWRVPPALPRPRRRKVLAQLRQLSKHSLKLKRVLSSKEHCDLPETVHLPGSGAALSSMTP